MNFSQRAKMLSPFLRVVVGFILIYSGYVKITEPIEIFYTSILSYKIIGEKLAYLTALLLPWMELYLGVFVVLGLFERYVLILSFFLFISFEILLIQAMIRGLDIVSCGCFGSRYSNPIEVEFVLNLAWLFFLFISYRFKTEFCLDNLIEKKFNK